MKKFLLLISLFVFMITGCSSPEKNETSIETDQFQLDSASFVAPKNWAGKYEVVEQENTVTAVHICEQAEHKQELFTLQKLTKEQFQTGGERVQESLVAQVGSDFYIAQLPLDMVYTDEQECIAEYEEMFLPFDSVKGRITVR